MDLILNCFLKSLSTPIKPQSTPPHWRSSSATPQLRVAPASSDWLDPVGPSTVVHRECWKGRIWTNGKWLYIIHTLFTNITKSHNTFWDCFLKIKISLFSMGLSFLFCWFIYQYPQARNWYWPIHPLKVIYIYSILKFTQVHVLTTNQTMPVQCFLKINSETSTGHHAPWVPRVDAVSLEPFPVCRTCPPWLAWAHHRAFRVQSLATWSKRSPGLCHFTHEWPRTPIRQELKFQNQHRFLQDGKWHIFALGL